MIKKKKYIYICNMKHKEKKMGKTKNKRRNSLSASLSVALKARVADDVTLMEISECSSKEQILNYAKWLVETYNIGLPSALLQMKKTLKLRRVKDLWLNSLNEIVYKENEYY